MKHGKGNYTYSAKQKNIHNISGSVLNVPLWGIEPVPTSSMYTVLKLNVHKIIITQFIRMKRIPNDPKCSIYKKCVNRNQGALIFSNTVSLGHGSEL